MFPLHFFILKINIFYVIRCILKRLLFFFFSLSFFSCSLLATTATYQTPKEFITKAFSGNYPKAKVLWLTAQDKLIIENIMNRKIHLLRMRYWQLENETVWIVDEIGKEKPITIGVHINQNQISELKVLTYRESRGDEVRHDFFTKQFKNAFLEKENMLSQQIDGITGATMSVRALTKVARLTLWLHNKIQVKG